MIVLGVSVFVWKQGLVVEKENDRWMNGRIANNRNLQPASFIILFQNNNVVRVNLIST